SVSLPAGSIETEDGGRIVGREVCLAEQPGRPSIKRDGSKVYPNGVVDYPPGSTWIRFLPRTNTVLTSDPAVLVFDPDGKTVLGEVRPDGSYLSRVDGTRSFPDGTRLSGDEWRLPGDLRVDGQGRLLDHPGPPIDPRGGPPHLGRGA